MAQTPDQWDIAAAHPEFKALMRAKRRFIVPAFVFFVVYYFALPVLVGYAPALMATPVIGPREHRVPVRALAVLRRVVHRVAVRAPGGALR